MKEKNVRVLAKIAKVVAPVWAFKKFAVKSNKYGHLFLLGDTKSGYLKEREIYYKMARINFNLVKKHLWSDVCRKFLLENRDWRLFSEIQTYEEFLLVWKSEERFLISRALRVYTPSKENCINLLFFSQELMKKNSSFYRSEEIAANFSELTENISASEIINEIRVDIAIRRNVALAICVKNPGRAVEFLEEFKELKDKNFAFRNSFEKDYFCKLANYAYEKVSLAPWMPVLKNWHKDLYKKIRENSKPEEIIMAL